MKESVRKKTERHKETFLNVITVRNIVFQNVLLCGWMQKYNMFSICIQMFHFDAFCGWKIIISLFLRGLDEWEHNGGGGFSGACGW